MDILAFGSISKVIVPAGLSKAGGLLRLRQHLSEVKPKEAMPKMS
jgi:hypothetical protein